MERRAENLFYLYGGSLGGFFPALFLIENLRLNQEKAPVNYYIVTSRHKKILDELAAGYPFIKIIEFNKRHCLRSLALFIRKLPAVNYVATPPLFDPPTFKTAGFLGRLLTLLNRQSAFRSKTIGPDDRQNIFDLTKYIIRELGFVIKKEKPDFQFTPDATLLDNHQLAPQTYIVVHPFAANPSRSLPVDRWRALLKHLTDNYQSKIIISGGPNDKKAADLIVKDLSSQVEFGSSPKIINTVGQGNLQQRATLIDRALGYIGVDTGITHLACLLKKTSVIIGNLSNPCWLPTYNPKAKILFNKERCLCQGNKRGDCFVHYNGVNYFRCLFFIPQREIELATADLFKDR